MNFRDIADEVGVSIATVSRVYNGQKGVGEKTRKKIEEVLKRNNYLVDRDKRSRAMVRAEGKAPAMISVVLYEAGNHVVERNEDYFAGILMGAERRAKELGYMLSFVHIKTEDFEDYISSSKNWDLCKGILLFATELTRDKFDIIEKSDVPIVAIDNEMKGVSCNSVCPDNVYGTYKALEHLKELGHERIGLLAPLCPMGGLPAREKGYYEAMKELGLSVNEKYIIPMDHILESCIKQMDEYLDSHTDLPTAFFAVNDAIGVGATISLKKHGYNVPGDVSIMGFDDANIGNSSQPRLSTMKIDGGSIGRIAINRLDHIINGDESVIRIFLETPLLEKDSTIRRNPSSV